MPINILVGAINTILVQVFKKAQSIPLNPGQTGRIRAVVALLSFLGALGNAYLTGSPEYEGLLMRAAEIIADTILNFVMSTGFYAGFMKK